MQHRMFTPLQLPELFDVLEGFGIRLVRKPRDGLHESGESERPT